MLKALSRAGGLVLSLAVVVEHAHADLPFPDQCWPYCQQWWQQLNQECQAWFGSSYTYCGYNNGWVYCCGGD